MSKVKPYNLVDSEEQYDEIMREGRKIFKFRKNVEDPYAFHKAFEHCLNKLGIEDV